MFSFLKKIDAKGYRPRLGGEDIFKFIGPGLLVTVGFIDPGNWASNIAAGADFIKTSTGKSDPAATLEAAYIMSGAIKEYYEKTGIKIGFKPAGGVATTEEAVKFYTVVHSVLGDDWMNNKLFRFGASRLANNLLSSIYDKTVKYF